MLEKAKKAGLSFYFGIVSCLLVVVGFVFTLKSNAIQGYAFTNGAIIIAVLVVGLILIATSLFSNMKYGSNHILTFLTRLVALVFVGIAFSLIIQDRAGGAGALFTWDSGNGSLAAAFRSAVVAAVCYLIAIISIIISGFTGNEK